MDLRTTRWVNHPKPFPINLIPRTQITACPKRHHPTDARTMGCPP